MLYLIARNASAAAVIGMGISNAWAADMAVTAPPAYLPADPWNTVWSGFEVTKDSDCGYAAGQFTLEGNPNRERWVFQISGGDGHYTYNRAVGFSQGVDFETGDAMFGYRTFLGRASLTGFLGGYVQNDNNPDPAAKVTGTRRVEQLS